MEWTGITGSWRIGSPEVEHDVEKMVTNELEAGRGIVTGGALGVDYLATDVAMAFDPTASRLRIYLPVSADLYAAHYRRRAQEGVITMETAEKLANQLKSVQVASALVIIADPFELQVNAASYYARNSMVVAASNRLLAFRVNGSAGTQDTIDKATAAGKLVTIMSYQIDA
jgi:predicted Rossmann fold nucleotide-binding protein DprA/Smf involved in DNA uptake